MNKYDVAKQYSAGFSAGMCMTEPRHSDSPHWLAGWDDGYALRPAKNRMMNVYLVLNGLESMATVTTCTTGKVEP